MSDVAIRVVDSGPEQSHSSSQLQDMSRAKYLRGTPGVQVRLKKQRHRDVFHLLLNVQEPLTATTVAEELEVSRTAAKRMLAELSRPSVRALIATPIGHFWNEQLVPRTAGK